MSATFGIVSESLAAPLFDEGGGGASSVASFLDAGTATGDLVGSRVATLAMTASGTETTVVGPARAVAGVAGAVAAVVVVVESEVVVGFIAVSVAVAVAVDVVAVVALEAPVIAAAFAYSDISHFALPSIAIPYFLFWSASRMSEISFISDTENQCSFFVPTATQLFTSPRGLFTWRKKFFDWVA
jgi:hypothetical protein